MAFPLIKTASILTLALLLNAKVANALPIVWDVKPDYLQDSLPIPEGEFELKGLATGQDADYLYISVYGNPSQITGLDYKGKKIHIGDLMLRYTDGSNQTIRISPHNRSELPYGKIVTNSALFSVANQVHGQETMTQYTQRLLTLGITPFNTYSAQSQLTNESLSLGRASSSSTFDNISFVDSDWNVKGLGNPIATVKIAKSLLLEKAGTISVTLECGNDYIEIDIPKLTSLEVITQIEIPTEVEATYNLSEDLPIEDGNGATPYIIGGTALVLLAILLLGGEDSANGTYTVVDNPFPEIVPEVSPTITPQTPPTENPLALVEESTNPLSFVLLGLFLLCYTRRAAR